MEFLRSLHHQVWNNGHIIQSNIAKMHNALLRCLADTAPICGKEDYDPGIVELYERFSFTPFSTVLRLSVSRSEVDIFTTPEGLPCLKIVRKFGGRYAVINGQSQEIFGEIRHESYWDIPAVIMKFAEQSLQPENRKPNIHFSRIS